MRAFPEDEESVRVPLREKYKSLLQRVKQCSFPGMNTKYLLFICQDSCFVLVNVFFKVVGCRNNISVPCLFSRG